MEQPARFETVRAKFQDGSIRSATVEELEASVSGLATTSIQNDSVRHEALVMADAIHSILLRRLLDEQEKRNAKTQRWFMVLAIGSLISSGVQIVLAQLR